MSANIEDLRKKRHQPNGHGPGVIGNGPAYNAFASTSQASNGHANPMYFDHHHNHMMGHMDNLSTLGQSFGGLSVSSMPNTKPSPQMSTVSSEFGGVPLGSPMPQTLMHNGQIMFTGHYLPQGPAPSQATMPQSPGMYNAFGPQFYNPQGFAGYPQLFTSHSPVSQWNSSRVPSSEMPALVSPRRDSSSSNEHDQPSTPFTQYTTSVDNRTIIPVFDRSPNSTYTWSTPSPIIKQAPSPEISPRLLGIVHQDPPIPPAVPASFSPLKPLDRCLENRHGVTNVYIRGLQPNTTDDMLYKLASRFGDIVSSKSIIDRGSGRCKGFGFVKYHSYKDAEDCIRGFHFMGYETSFARESFYSQLKKLQDEDNTNLYVSNLPLEMNEHELETLFHPHKVLSCRVLRKDDGEGRGVGFARLETREICDEMIKKFQDAPPGNELQNIQIRFADTAEQKQLKQSTSLARQYRTAEYEFQTTGRRIMPNVGVNIAPPNDFESYMASQTGSVASSIRGYPAHTRRLSAKERLSSLSSHLSPKNGRPTAGVSHSPLHKTDSVGGAYLDDNETITIKINNSDKPT